MCVFCCCFLSAEQAAGVYHRESRKGRYQLTYKEAKAVCKFEGGSLATYDQLEAARQIGLSCQFFVVVVVVICIFLTIYYYLIWYIYTWELIYR